MQALRVGPCVAIGSMLLFSGFHSEVSFVHRLSGIPYKHQAKRISYAVLELIGKS